MQAQGFFDQTCYETAADIFKGLGDYPNAEEMWKESVYQQALQLANVYNSEETYIVSSGYFSDSDSIYSLLESIKGYKRQMIGWTSSSFYKRLRPMKMKGSILLILVRLRSLSPILTGITITNIKMRTARLQVGLQLTVENPNYSMKTARLFTKG